MTRDELDPLDDEVTSDREDEGRASEEPKEGAPDENEFSDEPLEPTPFEAEAAEPPNVETGVVESDLAGTAGAQAVSNPYDNFDNQAAVDRFFAAYREQQAAKRAAAGESEDGGLLPADAPLRREDGYFYAEPRRLPPPTPFEELVFGYSKPRSPEPTPEVEERWLPPEFLPQGPQSQPSGPAVPSPEGEIKVIVEVRLTGEARERITDQAIAKAAQTHQNHTEIVAKRLYELTREIRDREAARRVLYRR